MRNGLPHIAELQEEEGIWGSASAIFNRSELHPSYVNQMDIVDSIRPIFFEVLLRGP